MNATNVTIEQMEQALAAINKSHFDGNVTFKRFPEPIGRKLRFTLTVRDSSKPGGRRSDSGRRICAACWHVHGEFFDALFAIEPEAVIASSGRDGLITSTADYGNWQDRNIGSMVRPFYYSDACECGN